MFSSTNDAGNVAHAVVVQQQSERTALTEFDDFSTPPSVGLLKKMRLATGQSSYPPANKQKIVEVSEKPQVSLDKDKVMPNIEMRDADKAPATSEEKLSLFKSDLDEIKSYVRTYVAQYPMHESEKGNPNIEVDPLQSVNERTTDAKSYNVVDAAGQSSKLGVNEGETEESMKAEAESSYADKLQEDDRHIIVAEIVEAIMKEREFEKALHNTDEDFSKVITFYVPPSLATYPTGINYEDAATTDTCDRKLTSKRNRQPSKVYQSPFVSVFDSGSKDKEVIQSHKKLKYPFEGHNINGPYAEDLFSKFSVWMSAGLYNPHANKSHSEVDLGSHVKNIRSLKVTSVERSICEIMQGLCISAGIPWHLIDEVYVPINCKGSFHWVLIVIVLKEISIRVYDSIKGHRGHADEIKELAKMLSTYLIISDFFEKKDRTDWSLLDAYKEKTDQHAFNVHIVDRIVQQSSGTLDCGLFVAAYAEFLSDRHQIPSSEFNSKKHRTRYASLLWEYGVNKACTGYVSENQDSPSLNAPSFDLRIQR
ncbi:hypothetical protein T459_32216 [Capsicum annuum]|uniref:Ubiquitin-like protease family profile domain-containing protein n=1 Tax=Capsicum annuum TaxID=4072 RepID=A0A2G2Y2F4_CAPAN|nr:hypothetical protein T459_32216 [Capsicum annuum]